MIPALTRRRGDRATNEDGTKVTARAGAGFLFHEDGERNSVRDFIATPLEEELSQALARPRCGRRPVGEALRGRSCRASVTVTGSSA